MRVLLFDALYGDIKKMSRTDGQTEKSFLYRLADCRLFSLGNTIIFLRNVVFH